MDALRTICELDPSELESAEPPRGFRAQLVLPKQHRAW
jgi:hypothetical protein